MKRLSFEEKSELIERLLACRSVSDRISREAILRQLPGDIRFGIEVASRDDIYMTNIIDACLAFPAGIEELIDIVQHYEKDSSAMQNLDDFLDEVFPKIIKSTHLRKLKSI